MTTVLDFRYRTARRPYHGWKWQCLWCYEMIVAGERFTECVYIDDGIQVSRLHAECEAACQRQRREPYEDQWELPDEAQPRGRTRSELADPWVNKSEDRSPALAE